MIVTKRDERTYDADSTAVGTHGITATDSAGGDRDENGMTRDDIFDQLADESHVVTSGRGSRIPTHENDDGTSATGYSSGIGSGTGSDN